MPPRRFLLTGASGFLGQAVTRRLHAARHEVVGLDIMPASTAGTAAHIIDDLSDPARLQALLEHHRPTCIIHAGGVSGPMVMSDQPVETLTVNVGGTLNLLRAASAAKVATFIHCSSISAVGSYYETDPIGDDHPLRPDTPYGCSKAACEMLLQGLFGRIAMDLCGLRFSTVYGPGRTTSLVTDAIADATLAGAAIEVPATSDWPYIFIDDAADATVAAALSSTRTQLMYFVSYPEQVSVQDLAAAAAVALGSAPIAVSMTGNPTNRGPVDIAPAMRDFAFSPKIDHREGMRRLVEARRVRP
ncbi:MAG: NAD(P)-dependent oxidoreductase [Hyphomicrobiaceae bacterium]